MTKKNADLASTISAVLGRLEMAPSPRSEVPSAKSEIWKNAERIFALRNGGWSYIRIAEELTASGFKCSVGTLTQYLRQWTKAKRKADEKQGGKSARMSQPFDMREL